MKFDANKIRRMAQGTDEPIDGFAGLRMSAGAKRRTWVYRYKSPLDGKMKQLGEWPAMPFSSAIAAWEEQRQIRSSGREEVSGISCVRRVEIQTPMLNRSG